MASGDQRTLRPEAMKQNYQKSGREKVVRLAALLIFLAVTVALAEGALHAVRWWGPAPLRAFLDEVRRIRRCNLRYYGPPGLPVPAILLPPARDADVVVVGDSFVFGTLVAAEDAFAERLGHLLDTLGRPLRVVNLGVPSTSPPQYNRLLELGMRYRPELVVYAFFANDFRYDSLPPVRRLSANETWRRRPEDEGLCYEALPLSVRLNHWRKWLTNHLLSFQLVKSLLSRHVYGRQGYPVVLGTRYYLLADTSWWGQWLDYGRLQVRRSVEANCALAREAAAFAERQGAKTAFALIPAREQVLAPFLPDTLARRVHAPAYDTTWQVLRRCLEAEGLPVLDLTPALRRAVRRGRRVYFAFDGHFDESGHEATASALAAFLRQHRLTVGR